MKLLACNGVSPLAQQTMIDVNSQPLVPVSTAPIPMQTQPQTQAQTVDTTTQTTLTSTDTPPNVEHVLDPTSPIITEFYERFSTGKIFQSLEALRNAAFDYGRKYNVAITTSKSDKTKIYLICKHGGQYRQNANRKRAAALALKRQEKCIKPRQRRSQKQGCCCLIYARRFKGQHWTIRKSQAQHNHQIAQDPRTYAMYRALQPEHLSTVHELLKENTGIANIVKTLVERGVNNIVPKDIENIQQDLKRKEAKERERVKIEATTSTSN
jgi:hypothetical protein